MSNPIKTSDLIQNDGALRSVINDINETLTLLKELKGVVKGYATEAKAAHGSASGATEGGRKGVEKLAAETEKLKVLADQLNGVLSEQGVKVAELKMRINDATRANNAAATSNMAIVGSYNQMKADLELLLRAYKSMNKEQALNSQEGQVLAGRIAHLRKEMQTLNKALDAELSSLDKYQQETASATAESERLAKAKRDLANATSEENKTLLSLMAETKEANKIAKLNATITREKEGSYNRLAAQYELNKIALNKMSAEERGNTASGKALEEQTFKIYQEMIRLQEATGKHVLSVGNYRRAWDGLGVSVNQIVRELPTAGISLNTFFLGISNNVPVLVDEIEKVKVANAQLAAEGKPTTNILGSIVKALFSWQTALTIVLTVLAMFGKEIFEWLGTLTKGEEVINRQAEAIRNYKSAMAEGERDAQKELVRLRLLYSASTNAAKSTEERTIAVKELKKEYPTYFANMTDEAVLVGKASAAYLDLASSILASARARAAENKIVENQEKMLELEEKIAKAKATRYDAQVQLDKASKGTVFAMEAESNALMAANRAARTGFSLSSGAVSVEQQKRKAYEDTSKALTDLNNQYRALESANKRLEKTVNISSLLSAPGDKTNAGAGFRTDPNLEIQKKYRESLTAMEEESAAKSKQILIDKFNTEKARLEDQLKRNKKLTAESRKQIGDIITNMEIALNKDLEDIDLKSVAKISDIKMRSYQMELAAQDDNTRIAADLREQILIEQRNKEIAENKLKVETERANEADIIRKYDKLIADEKNKSNAAIELRRIDNVTAGLQLELDATRENTAAALDLRLRILEQGRQKELAENRAKAEKDRQSEAKINAKWDFLANKEKFDSMSSMSMAEFDLMQDTERNKFETLRKSERKKTIFLLEQERDRLRKLLELASTPGSGATEKDLANLKSALGKAEKMLEDETGKMPNFYEMIGLGGAPDAYKAGINYAFSTTIANLQQIMALEVELAEKAEESARRRVDAAKEALSQEIDARNAGYASNVAQRQRDLEDERKSLEKAKKQKERAVKAQQQLDTVVQASSLITASANLWSSLSIVPIVGKFLAIAAIASMFASFAVAKVKANAAARAQTQEYGDGGLEFLEGGSHQSGNDIPIGTTKDGKQRRAEGGEALAIVNRDGTRRYKKVLPKIIDSLNKGVFEEKFTNAFNVSGLQLSVAGGSADLSRIEEDVTAIRKANEEKYIADGRGATIRIYKNLRQKYDS